MNEIVEYDDMKAHRQIEIVSDRFYDKYGYEAEVVYINKPIYLQLLREKEGFRKIGLDFRHPIPNRIVMGMEVRLHRSKEIKVEMRKK